MRWLIGLLLLLNLLLFLWTRMDPGEALQPEAPPPDVGDLRLWSEVEQERRAADAESPLGAPPAPASELPAVETPEAEATTGSQPMLSAPEPPGPLAEPAAAPPAATARLPVLPGPQTLAVAVEPESIPPEPQIVVDASEAPSRDSDRIDAEDVAGTRAAALGDSPDSQPPLQRKELVQQPLPVAPEAAIEFEVAAAAESSEPALVCGELRWFADQAAAAALAESLAAQGVVAEVRVEEHQEQTGFWVLVPPQETGDAARAVRTQLRDKGVEDLWLFTAGPMRHSISLGMFRGRGRAERRADEIRALGFDVEVRPKLTDKTEFLVSYQAEPGAVAAVEAVVTAQPEFENHAVVCP
jgi:hypothetical protein